MSTLTPEQVAAYRAELELSLPPGAVIAAAWACETPETCDEEFHATVVWPWDHHSALCPPRVRSARRARRGRGKRRA